LCWGPSSLAVFISAISAVFPQVFRGSVFEANGFLFSMPVIPNAPIHHQSPAFVFLLCVPPSPTSIMALPISGD
jgi:hypothetical protein